ncbi:hypothetical protein GSI_08335 [Ganoderma sinense ZZ0214-1]|uniref:Uncharacterized protein n=1 Tax=Ganoderma sinense ZZ0214-1 TaxID=1077348 RepID=A0A2G8S724_9APHY|nr:hypothetical protein GSI_08335 [Ganoderma sinense ZZ0214-1]
MSSQLRVTAPESADDPGSSSLLPQAMDASTLPPYIPIEIVHLIMDQLYNGSLPRDHCYRNQTTYRHWSLVCHAWRPYAQALLFRIVEVTDASSLRRFAALLDSAPRLASCVRLLRVYSRHLHTPENVFACLPVVLGSRLINLRELAVSRISQDDTWHPHAQSPPLSCELSYMPLPSHFFAALPVLGTVTTLKIYWVTFETFGAFARTVHSLSSLRTLVCIQARWCLLGEPYPSTLPGPSQSAMHGKFLPQLEDLTVSFLAIHGAERLLSSLDGSSITKLYIDCPTYHSTVVTPFNPSDPWTGFGLGTDLRRFPRLRTLWVSIPYTLAIFPELPDAFATLLRSWTPRESEEGEGTRTRTLTITPTYEYDFSRGDFVDVLRALGPVVEGILLGGDGAHQHDPSGSRDRDRTQGEGPAVEVEVEVEVCVIDKAEERRRWWRGVARACFPRMHEEGRLRSTFTKGFAAYASPTEYWDYWDWKDVPSETASEVGPPGATVEDAPLPEAPAELGPHGEAGHGGVPVHPGPGHGAVGEEATSVGGCSPTTKFRWRKRLNRPVRALAGILAGVRMRLKLGKLAIVKASLHEA